MKKTGLIGKKLGHSLSPQIHTEFYRLTDMEGRYDLLETPESGLSALLDDLQAKEYTGVNVTIPYKKAVMPLLDELSDEASAIGAVNTIRFSDGRRCGHNTDVYGLKALLETNNITVAKQRVVILGTGGAARCAHYLSKDMGAREVITVSRSPETSDSVFGAVPYAALDALDTVDVLVNTTPVGMHPHTDASPVSQDVIRKCAAVIDLIYNPQQTQLLRYAAQLGKRWANGLLMLSAQAVKSQEIWNGATYAPDIYAAVHAHVAGILRGRKSNIVLIGMPGSGKTTIGQRLAAALGRRFVDTDDLIEEDHGPIPDIFATHGEAVFRKYENAAAQAAADMCGAVISTGGGIILDEQNMQALNRTSVIVFLDRPLDKLIADTDTSYRPLLKDGKAALTALYHQRYPLYNKYADITMGNNADIDTCVADIIQQTKEKLS